MPFNKRSERYSLLLPIIIPWWERFCTSKENWPSAARMSKKTSMASGRGAGLAAVIVRRKTISDGRFGLKLPSVWLKQNHKVHFGLQMRYLWKDLTMVLWVKISNWILCAVAGWWVESLISVRQQIIFEFAITSYCVNPFSHRPKTVLTYI